MSEWATVVSVLIAALGLFLAARQLRLLNQNARYERRVTLDGVVVSWQPIEAPHCAEYDDGTARWKYHISVQNPGRLPIHTVTVTWVFPCPIRRLRHDDELDDATTTLTLHTPVLAGGEERDWDRWLRIDFEESKALARTYAEVEFYDIDNKKHTNRWPPRLPETDRPSA